MDITLLITYSIQWVFIIILVCFSGLFSGLNLGLMSLTLNDLTIVVCSGTPREAKYAKRIYPIRRRGNLLLCTILLGNVAVNALLSILLAGFTSGLVGFLSSTIAIVIFGEIVPQAVCSRHALAVGYYTVWFVWCFEIVLLPISYPISKILDIVLGREIGTIYTRAELRKLVDIHSKSQHTDLTLEETTILSGALDFGNKQVSSVMTPIDEVFMMNIDENLDGNTIAKLLSAGYSRVPVYKGEKDNIVGLLFVKDLALLNPDDDLPLSKILEFYGRNFPRVFDDASLSEMLKEFKKGQSHIAVVRKVNSGGDGDPFYENVGIITLEDVIEEILQEEILDETDVYVSNTSRVPVRGRQAIDYNQLRSQLSGMGNDEKAVSSTIKSLRMMDEFSTSNISDSVLRNLVVQCMGTYSAGTQIFSPSIAPLGMIAVVSGTIEEKGTDGSVTTHGPGDSLANHILHEDWSPSYTATAQTDVQAACITRRQYQSALQATNIERDHTGPAGDMDEDDPF